MKLFILICCFLLGEQVFCQEQYNIAFDTNYRSAIMQQNILVNGSFYGIGGALCDTGECGYLTKYSTEGERYWTIEYPQIDINSHKVSHYKNGKIYITGRAKDSIATKTLVLDTLGLILNDWNYSVEGATTNFSKEVFYDKDYYYFITKEVISQESRGALYKCDYLGKLVERLVFPKLDFALPLSISPYKENVIVSINYRQQEFCPFGLGANSPGATYLAEVDKENMTIIRDKKDVCFRSVSNDIYVTPSSELIRTVIIRDTLQEGNESDFGLIYYKDDWEVNDVKVFQHDLAKAITNILFLQNGQYFSIQIENIPQSDGSSMPFQDLLIQKWTSSHEIIWEKRYESHSKMKRLNAINLSQDDIGNLHIVGFVWPETFTNETFDFWLLSVDSEGCYNGNCNDVINLDDPVNTSQLIPTNNTLIIYPNPASSLIFLEQNKIGNTVEIIDIFGNVVIKENYNSSGIDISPLPIGLYIVSVKGFTSKKIIKI